MAIEGIESALRAAGSYLSQMRDQEGRAFGDKSNLIVAAVLGFEGALIALGVSVAAKAKPAPPSAFRVEMAKPPYCSIKTPDRLIFL